MADAVTSRLIHDGGRNVVYHFTNVSDTTGESKVTKIDISTLSGVFDDIKIMRIKFATRGVGVRFEWDATADDVAFEVPANVTDEWCWKEVGGLINPKSAGWNGDLLLSTVGTAAANDGYDITLTCRKRGQ